MIKAVVFYGLSALMIAGSAANAANNCDTYSVVSGDTLRLISERYYGARDLSPLIYDANAVLIGRNPNSIEIGMELLIPCRENMQISQPTAFLAIVNPDAEIAQNIVPRFLAKAGETPFIKQDNSGLIPDIIAAALRAGGYQNSFDITRPESISDVIQASTESSSLLSFPWTLPDCGEPASLSPQLDSMCGRYTFSDPLFEITLGIFTPADNALASAQGASSFEGKTICVPQFHTSDLLKQNGIAETSAIIVLAPDFPSCIAGMATGEFDAALADYQSFGIIAGSDTNLVDIPVFAQKTTLHAAAYSENPAALEVLEMVNSGMEKILMSGDWFRIVNQNLSNLSY